MPLDDDGGLVAVGGLVIVVVTVAVAVDVLCVGAVLDELLADEELDGELDGELDEECVVDEQSLVASALTVLAPCDRLRASVVLIDGGRLPTALVSAAPAVPAEGH